MIDLPERSLKPREFGITAITDVGDVSSSELEMVLEDYSDFLDIAKFGVGSAYISPNLQRKIDIYKAHGVEPYFGGTLFEKYYAVGRLDNYKKFMAEYKIGLVEISEGVVVISLEERLKIAEDFKKNFDVLSEVGCKDKETIMPPSVWINEIKAFCNVGCRYVITEGRDSATVGIYRPSGEIRTGLVTDIKLSVDIKKVIFEAPTSESQMFFINFAGPNVNLGNVNLRDLLLLESQRVGLRYETFNITN